MKNLNRVHLNGLRAVEAVGRLGSLAAAADELAVSVGAVSQQIIRCERRLGAALFDRTGRGIAPTAFGRELIQKLSAGFRALDEAVGLSLRHADAVLTISVPPVLASRWLVPRLSHFSARYPEVRVRLDASVAHVNLDASDVDLAIRVGKGDWPGVRRDFLLAQEVFPICAPDMAGQLQRPEDLRAVPVVKDANSVFDWDIWLAPFGMQDGELTIRHTFTDASLCLDAVIAGQGVMLAWQPLAQYALSVGQVVAPFNARARTGLGYWLLTSEKRPLAGKVSAFRDWAVEEMSATA